MNTIEQNYVFLRQYLSARKTAPWVAAYATERATYALYTLGGMAGIWGLSYPSTCYSVPQIVNGKTIDLSTPEKVRAYYERRAYETTPPAISSKTD